MADPIMIDASFLRRDFATERKEGVCAEFHPTGQLAYLGVYREGRPLTGSWQLSVDPDGRRATAERRFVLTRSASEGEDPSEAKSQHPYRPERGRAAERYLQWVKGIIDQIYSTAEGVKERCSFCQEPPAAGERLITGPGVSICAACVKLCSEILLQPTRAKKPWWRIF